MVRITIAVILFISIVIGGLYFLGQERETIAPYTRVNRGQDYEILDRDCNCRYFVPVGFEQIPASFKDDQVEWLRAFSPDADNPEFIFRIGKNESDIDRSTLLAGYRLERSNQGQLLEGLRTMPASETIRSGAEEGIYTRFIRNKPVLHSTEDAIEIQEAVMLLRKEGIYYIFSLILPVEADSDQILNFFNRISLIDDASP